tara:strand:- start:574 stop:1089 length:516 start_codon:yes stop_codon:yes gene_type:complete
MSFAVQLREIVDKQRPIAEKKNERIRVAKEELFKKISEKYLEDIYNNIYRAKVSGKDQKFMNHSREDFKINISGAGNPAEILRDWINEVKNPNSRFLVKSKETGETLCLKGINTFVWNNQKFTTEFTWDTRGCPHVGRSCNCLGLNKNSLNMDDKFSFNNYKRMNIAKLCL